MSGFSVSNSGVSTTNYLNDTAMYYLGDTEFSGPPNWSIMLLNPVTETNSGIITTTGSSNWTVLGVGKILSITLQTDTTDYNRKYVFVVLQHGGGAYIAGSGNTYNPPTVSCFVEGTHILTQNGYKTVETLLSTDLIMTSDNRAVPFKLLKTYIPSATHITAPYLIQPGAFGKNVPATYLRLSPLHKVQLRKGLWTYPEYATKKNPLIQQYGVGEPITYYHIECPNYLQDNIIAEGTVVESYGSRNFLQTINIMYTYNKRLGGFTRISPGVIETQHSK